MRDFQKGKLYSWEHKYISPRMDEKLYETDYMQMLVDYMWGLMGQVKPPVVYSDNTYKTKSTGNRYSIRLMPSMHTQHTLVHELAHSVNGLEHRDTYDGHGPNFVADYCYLLERFYQFDINYLIWSLKEHKVKINMDHYYKNKEEFGEWKIPQHYMD